MDIAESSVTRGGRVVGKEIDSLPGATNNPTRSRDAVEFNVAEKVSEVRNLAGVRIGQRQGAGTYASNVGIRNQTEPS